jgi:hypothetical protein
MIKSWASFEHFILDLNQKFINDVPNQPDVAVKGLRVRDSIAGKVIYSMRLKEDIVEPNFYEYQRH